MLHVFWKKSALAQSLWLKIPWMVFLYYISAMTGARNLLCCKMKGGKSEELIKRKALTWIAGSCLISLDFGIQGR